VSEGERADAVARLRELGYMDDVEVARGRARTLLGRGAAPGLAERRLGEQGVGAAQARAAVVEAAQGASEAELLERALHKMLRGGDPVINGEGLVGKVTQVASDGAQVSLITDSTMGVSARLGTTPATGIVQPRVGEPNDLLLQYLPPSTQANRGDYVVTSGTVASPDDSLYPPGIPIGQVTSVNEESAYRSVNVHPLADLHNLDVVQVLTAGTGSLPANISRLAASLPPGQHVAAVAAGGEALASRSGP